jgi:ppGpp synthetase/RelA/SpoT-type nucleotidyltranferase
MRENLEQAYKARLPFLSQLKDNFEHETKEALANLHHIDRVSFRVKGIQSFLDKALDLTNNPPYSDPLVEIEDQVAGRVIVFFLSDMDHVRDKLSQTFNTIEWSRRKPEKDQEFGYESEHLICTIPPHIWPPGWEAQTDLPRTVEIQLRTILMHAYAEPQHDIAYKASTDLPPEIRKELAWIAASTWGADQAYQRIMEWYAKHHLD